MNNSINELHLLDTSEYSFKTVIEYTIHNDHIGGFVAGDLDVEEKLTEIIQYKYNKEDLTIKGFNVNKDFLESEEFFKNEEMFLEEEVLRNDRTIKTWTKYLTKEEAENFITRYEKWKPNRINSFKQFYEGVDNEDKHSDGTGPKLSSIIYFINKDHNYIDILVNSPVTNFVWDATQILLRKYPYSRENNNRSSFDSSDSISINALDLVDLFDGIFKNKHSDDNVIGWSSPLTEEEAKSFLIQLENFKPKTIKSFKSFYEGVRNDLDDRLKDITFEGELYPAEKIVYKESSWKMEYVITEDEKIVFRLYCDRDFEESFHYYEDALKTLKQYISDDGDGPNIKSFKDFHI
jgi:hypothetical protein